MDQQAIEFRRATEGDEPAIRALVRSERLNPTGLDWPNFIVAATGERIVGAVQMRRHADGSREVGSLVVAEQERGRGIASRMMEALLAAEREPVWMITGESHARTWAQWGFRRIEPSAAPVRVRFNYRIGRLARILSFLRRQPARPLVILERQPVERRRNSAAGASRQEIRVLAEG